MQLQHHITSLISCLISFRQSSAPRIDSTPVRHWQEAALVSTEDPSLRMARVSPSHQTNGHEERTPSTARAEESRGPTRQNHPEHLNTGPAFPSVRSSYVHYNDVDADYNMQWDQTRWLNSGYREQVAPRHSPGAFNGPQEAGQMWYPSKHSFSMSRDFNDYAAQSFQTVDRSSARSPAEDWRGQCREPRSCSPLTPSPAAPSYAEHNGCGPPPFLADDGRYSSVPSRSSRSPKKGRRHINTEPTPTGVHQGHQSHPVLSRAERMAALERRMVANGLSSPGRSRSGSSGKGRKGRAGAGGASGGVSSHMAAVNMGDLGTTSGSESSESEAETNRDGGSPQTCDNQAEANGAPLPRNKFSFGSLQLDEEADEDGCHAFSDEEVGQIFSC